jgi:hypothetical protein
MREKTKDLSVIKEEELLNLRLCELPLKIEGTQLQENIKALYRELDNKQIKFKPECYLADEWLTPDGEPVVGIPFFLAHPVLIRLEKKMMLEAEGQTKQWCMKLLRHETGHALNYAYKLYRRKKWQDMFGKFSQDYPDTYRFRPYSKNFVRHLEDYYAQYHPDEDFAETFAVWLAPNSHWKEKYKGWKALDKLNYVDELINKIKDKPPLVSKGKKYWQVGCLKTRLRNYYKKKRSFWAESLPDFHDSNLRKMFEPGPVKEDRRLSILVSEVIKKHKRAIRQEVSLWTGEKKYVIDDLLRVLIQRGRELDLVIPNQEQDNAVIKVSVYLTTLIMNYIYTGKFRKDKE